jgi:hypothetical protein
VPVASKVATSIAGAFELLECVWRVAFFKMYHAQMQPAAARAVECFQIIDEPSIMQRSKRWVTYVLQTARRVRLNWRGNRNQSSPQPFHVGISFVVKRGIHVKPLVTLG